MPKHVKAWTMLNCIKNYMYFECKSRTLGKIFIYTHTTPSHIDFTPGSHTFLLAVHPSLHLSFELPAVFVVASVVQKLAAVAKAAEAGFLVVFTNVRCVVPAHCSSQVSRCTDRTLPENEGCYTQCARTIIQYVRLGEPWNEGP